MKKILFPTDFSERANKALDQALMIAEAFNSKMIIHHTYSRSVDSGNTSGHPGRRINSLESEQNFDLAFKKLLDKSEKLRNVSHVFNSAQGTVVENIINTSTKEQVDLIIMATKGARGFGELFGTKTAKIVKSADVPILVIPDNATLENVNKLGLICDYSREINYGSLEFLLKLASQLKLYVDVITINRSEKVMTDSEKTYRQQVLKKLESVPSTVNFSFNSNVDEGIIDYSKKNDIGMIAMMPKSYSFMERLFHESLTEKMTFSSPIPLLVLK
jgi:nucleotide-binding universal stress UspA family protein